MADEEKADLTNVLFVCTGNTCRSPMAEHLMKWLYEIRGIDGYAASRGLSASSEFNLSVKKKLHATLESALAVKELDAISRISMHIPLPLAYEDVEDAGIVLTMTEDHRDTIIDYAKGMYRDDFSRKVFTLKEYAGFAEEYDVQDPMTGHGEYEKIDGKKVWVKKSDEEILQIYRNCRDEILTCLECILDSPAPALEPILETREIRKLIREEEEKKHKKSRAYREDDD